MTFDDEYLMMVLWLLASLVAARGRLVSAVVGGEFAREAQFPFAVNLLLKVGAKIELK